jgi:dTDP-4-amino-4,6-dideoxygalactose transaminase
MIPLCDFTEQYQNLKPEIDAAVGAVLAGGQYILGPNVKAFEREIANYLGCDHAVGVANGTDALHLALRALGIGPGDEVITTPFSFIATTEAIGLVGATPVFVDVDPRTFNLDARRISRAITDRTKAILPVHLYGQPCEMDAILSIAERHGLFVVEDCAQAIGAEYLGRRVGTWGTVGCFSFFPTKNLGCCGDGGLVVTNDERLAERVESLRRHGGKVKYHHAELGLNSRLDELQAAILRVKLPHLDAWNERRRQIAYEYNRLLAPLTGVTRPAEWCGSKLSVPTNVSTASDVLRAVYHQYTLLVEDRPHTIARLAENGVASFAYYPVPLHLQQVHRALGYATGDFPIAERLAATCLSLPMFPELAPGAQAHVAQSLTCAALASAA